MDKDSSEMDSSEMDSSEMEFPDLPLDEEFGLKAEEKAKELGIEFIIPTVYSLGLGIRGPVVPIRALKDTVCNGCNLHGYKDFAYGGEQAECYAVPDPKTLTALPWKKGYGWMACYLYYQGKISPRCPRYNLMKQRERLKKAGYSMKTGVEPEFYLFEDGNFEAYSNSERPCNKHDDPSLLLENSEFISEVIGCMEKLGWKPYQIEKERDTKQYELNITYDDVLVTADRIVLCKMMIKDIARKHGLNASFMPFVCQHFGFGNGQHIHLSLWDSNRNCMPGEGDLGLSTSGRHFLAGLVDHLDGLTPLANPTTNSYKRLHAIKNYLNFHGYGVHTRFPPLRIVKTNGISNRLEYRQPDGSINPYLCQAAIIAAGLDGLQKKQDPNPILRCEKPMFFESAPEHAKTMAPSLDLALLNLKADTTLVSALGEELVTAFCNVKELESAAHKKEVSQAEKDFLYLY